MHSRGTLNSDHRRHDRLLVTRHAAGDPYPADESHAETLIASCSECAALAADVRLLARRTSELPAPRRPRDFRISAEQAERLRGSWLDRIMRGLAAPGWGTALRPLAGATMALGLTLVIVGAFPLGASPAVLTDVGSSVQVRTTAEAPDQPGGVSAPAVQASPETSDGGVAAAEDPKEADPAALDDVYMESPAPEFAPDSTSRMESANPNAADLLLITGSLLAVLGAISLLVLWLARRRFGDALLR